MTNRNKQAAFNPVNTDWNLIRSFIAVVEHGSLTRAAENTGISQPTLSRQIASLEELIGAALFERVARGLKLTVLGESMAQAAKHMMVAARAIGDAANTQENELSGSVRIAASEIVAAHVFTSAFGFTRSTISGPANRSRRQ